MVQLLWLRGLVPLVILCLLCPLGSILASEGENTLPVVPRNWFESAKPCSSSAALFGTPCRPQASDRLFDPEPQPRAWLNPSSARPYWRTNLVKRVLSDQAFLMTNWWSAEVRRLDFALPMVAALGGASGSSASGIDLRLQRAVTGWTTGGRRDVAELLTRMGDRETGALLLGSTYLISRWTGNDRLSRATSLSAEAVLNGGIYSTLLKKMTLRTRPSVGGVGEFFVARPGNGQEPTSFPSGHALGAFAIAAVFSAEYRERRWVPWVAYGTASLIALSRVGLGRHFPSDVMAGAVLGRSLGKMVVHRNGEHRGDRPRTRLEPLFDPANNGLGIAYRRSW